MKSSNAFGEHLLTSVNCKPVLETHPLGLEQARGLTAFILHLVQNEQLVCIDILHALYPEQNYIFQLMCTTSTFTPSRLRL